MLPNELDKADWQQPFYGIYSTYTASPNNTLDIYYIGYDNRHPGAITSDFSLHTFGSRLFRTLEEGWMFETEGGVQLGPVGFGQVLARGRQDLGLLGHHVAQVAVHVALQGLLEGRAPWEYAAMLAALPWLKRLPRGDGHPVIVFPGLGAADITTAPRSST